MRHVKDLAFAQRIHGLAVAGLLGLGKRRVAQLAPRSRDHGTTFHPCSEGRSLCFHDTMTTMEAGNFPREASTGGATWNPAFMTHNSNPYGKCRSKRRVFRVMEAKAEKNSDASLSYH